MTHATRFSSPVIGKLELWIRKAQYSKNKVIRTHLIGLENKERKSIKEETCVLVCFHPADKDIPETG